MVAEVVIATYHSQTVKVFFIQGVVKPCYVPLNTIKQSTTICTHNFGVIVLHGPKDAMKSSFLASLRNSRQD